MVVTTRLGVPDDAAKLHDLAARTFPLACPVGTSAADIETFIAQHLSRSAFELYLKDDSRTVLLAAVDGRPAGYTMLATGPITDPDVRAVVDDATSIELSKFYVAGESHGTGVADVLMRATLESAAATGAGSCWLGVSRHNARANRFYARHGFEVVGAKRFLIGADWQDDHVRLRRL
jgi:ribosomal protein S18 acetylase RimI-like enzyme